MKASFIIPLCNCLPLTQTMLDSLLSTLTKNFEYEIIFVDDASTDGTREWLKQLPHRTILNKKNMGFAATCNRGAAAATGDLIFFLNNDLILQPGWTETMLRGFDLFSNVGLIGNIQINAATGLIDHTGITFNHKGKPEHQTSVPLLGRVKGHHEVAALTGACFVIQRSTWNQLGGFDEGFINGAEDVDLCLRASSRGLRNFVALRSIVRHHVSASIGRKLRDEQNTYRLINRWNDAVIRLSARDWCKHFITTHWDKSFVYDYTLGREALYYVLGISTKPSALVLEHTQLAINFEIQRWRKLFPNEDRSLD